MEQFSQLVQLRRSMRKFTDEKITPEQERLLLRAALMAPSSKGMHPWRFEVVKDSQRINELSHCKAQGSDFLAGAPMAIVVMADPQISDVWIEDASVASTYLLLQAEDLGLGSCWIQVRERKDAEGNDAEENVRRIIGAEPSLRVLSIIALGHKGMERKPFNEERLLWKNVKGL